MNYKGYDWTELSKCFGLFENEYEDEITLKNTRDYLFNNHFSNTEYLAKEIRSFLTLLYENSAKVKKGNSSIWKGLLEVENDWILVKYTIVLLEHMWI